MKVRNIGTFRPSGPTAQDDTRRHPTTPTDAHERETRDPCRHPNGVTPDSPLLCCTTWYAPPTRTSVGSALRQAANRRLLRISGAPMLHITRHRTPVAVPSRRTPTAELASHGSRRRLRRRTAGPAPSASGPGAVRRQSAIMSDLPAAHEADARHLARHRQREPHRGSASRSGPTSEQPRCRDRPGRRPPSHTPDTGRIAHARAGSDDRSKDMRKDLRPRKPGR